MPAGKEVIARLRVTTTTAGTVRAMTQMKMAWTAVGATVSQVTKMMALSVGHLAAVGGAFFAVTMLVKDYESAIVRAGAIGGLTTSQTAIMSNKLMASASKYGAASEEMAAGVLELTKAGFEFADVMESIDTITKVNIANNLDYASSAEISTLVMKAFKVEAKDLERHFDSLQYVVNKTLMDMGDFNELLRYAGSTAISAQVDPTELYAMAGALSDVAQQAGIGARGVNRMMIELLKNSQAFQEWSDSLGLGVEIIKDGKLNITELVMAFSQLEMTEDLLVESLERFSIRSARAWLGLQIAAEEYFDLIGGQENAAGYLDNVVGPQLDTIQNRLQRLKETLKTAFRTPEFLIGLKGAFDQLESSVVDLLPPLRDMVLNLLQQAPAMFEMLFNIIQGLLPLLANGLLPVFATFASILGTISGKNGYLLRMIISMMLINKFTPGLVRSLTLLGHAWRGIAITTLQAQQAISGLVFGMILIMSASKGIERALYLITIGVVTLTTAIVAMRAASGDIMAGVRAALMAAMASSSLLGLIALTRSSGQQQSEYNSKLMGSQRDEAASIAGSYQIGTRYVPRTGMAMVHEGEPIGTKASGVFGMGSGGVIVIENRGTIYGDEDAIKSLIRRVVAEEAEEAYS